MDRKLAVVYPGWIKMVIWIYHGENAGILWVAPTVANHTYIAAFQEEVTLHGSLLAELFTPSITFHLTNRKEFYIHASNFSIRVCW